MADTGTECVAFAGDRCIARGDLATVALAVKEFAEKSGAEPVFVFDASTSAPIDIDLRGTPEDVIARLAPAATLAEPTGPRAPGRPRLGVVGREVTLLPRHWEWLNEQPGGASVTLRKLVEQARKSGGEAERRRKAQDAAYRFMLSMSGNEPGYEEATRALYAGDEERFTRLTADWPTDVREHARSLASGAFETGE